MAKYFYVFFTFLYGIRKSHHSVKTLVNNGKEVLGGAVSGMSKGEPALFLWGDYRSVPSAGLLFLLNLFVYLSGDVHALVGGVVERDILSEVLIPAKCGHQVPHHRGARRLFLSDDTSLRFLDGYAECYDVTGHLCIV